MPITLVSRNSVKLPVGASTVDDYYLNHKAIITRTDSLGKQTVQTKEIIDYFGASRIALIDGLWQPDFIPSAGDKIDVVPKYPDSRVSINPAVQTLDYVSSKSYGRGLDVQKDLYLESWLNSARVCDTRSDIYVRILGGAIPIIGAVYTIGLSTWQGTVVEIIDDYVRFTDNIGKLSYKWNSWRTFLQQQFVYHENRLYAVTAAGVKTEAPTHTSGTANGLALMTAAAITKVSGPGPDGLQIYVDGNPVRYEKGGTPVSGYTLYDSDGVDYFRLLGWNSPDQREVTRHQTNLSIDTALPLFDNTNSMLQHFGGILRYAGDRYALEVEQAEDDILNVDDEPRNITADHIIGKISITDEGVRGAYNSLTVAYSDPANKFEARNISFFNSEFLKADRNVPKKGNLTIPGVTNYYNARILADKYLSRSRFGLSINLNIAPRGLLLQAGKVIQIQYPRYGWTNKKFRIENLTFNDDCTVDIVATEYDSSFYTISNIAKQNAIGLAGDTGMTTLGSPTNLRATNVTSDNELLGSIQLTWSDSPGANSPNVTTEVYASFSPNLYLEVDSITGGGNFNTLENHGLIVGQPIRVNSNLYGIQANRTYYVRNIAPTVFTLAEYRGGPDLNTFENTSNNFIVITAVVVARVTPPTNSYIDTNIFDISGNRVEKYYWVRYKINQL